MNYYGQHITNQNSSVIIPKTDLRKGMIIHNRYKNMEDEVKPYMFLVLNPAFHGKVHVLSLNEFSIKIFNDLARKVGVRLIHKYKKRALDIPKLIMRESSNRFYHHKLAGDRMEKLYNNSYRTLFIGRIGLIQLIDYRFDDDITRHLFD